ncbi:MAG: nucleotidyltransferase [Alphaproteobacteria bacterium]|nr:nucleotidyltransferase [Alphaproteobacteria bacterium]
MPTRRRTSLDRDAILRRLRESQALLDRYSVVRVGLFGSYATGTAKPKSDIDLLVAFDDPTYDNFLGLSRALEKLFGRKVEIITPEGLDSIRVRSISESIRQSLTYV